MKKIIFVLVVLMLTTSVWAGEVLITCAQDAPGDPNVTIGYVNTTGQPVRAFALNITVDGGATISAVECLNSDYYIYPGSIDIDDGEVEEGGWGSCVCDAGDYDDTLPGLDSNGVTIEMASLYAATDPEHTTAPADSGDLLKIKVSGACCITIEGNVLRGKVVLEDATSVDPNAPGCCATGFDPYVDTCWSAIQCPGQASGDATCDGNVNAVDLFKLKQSWLKKFGDVGYNCCANFNHDSFGVNAVDLFILKQNWLSSGLGGDLTQACPATEP